MNPPSDPLAPLMEQWRQATPPQPEALAGTVWHRIAALERNETKGSFFSRIELAFSRPAFAVAFVAASVLLGLFLAEVRLSYVRTQQTAELERTYRRLFDPLAEAGTSATPSAQPASIER